MEQEQSKLKFMIDSKLGEAAANVFKAYFSEPEAVTDRDMLLNAIIQEKGDKKHLAFSIFVGYCSTGLVSGEKISLAIMKTPSAEREKVHIMVESWLKNEPKESDALVVMEAVKEHSPELIADIIDGKPSWRPGDVRKIIMKYPLTEQLHIRLDELNRAKSQQSMSISATN